VSGVKESIKIIFRVKKVAGKGEFQDGRQNVCRALSASLSTSIIEGFRGQAFQSDHSFCQKNNGALLISVQGL